MPVAVMLMSGLFLGLRLAKHQLFGLVVAVLSLSLILGTEMQLGGYRLRYWYRLSWDGCGNSCGHVRIGAKTL